MQQCKKKHINIYMSFSNRPNLVWKASSETNSTRMDHNIVKALPQVIYENIGMWQSKFSDLSSFIKRWLTSNLKACPCHTLAKKMHIIQRSYKDIKFLTKDHWNTHKAKHVMLKLMSHVSTSGRLLHWWTSCNMFCTHVCKIRHFKHKHDGWSIFQAYTLLFKINSFHGTWSAFAGKTSLCSSMNAT
jgi:hypothetical protein